MIKITRVAVIFVLAAGLLTSCTATTDFQNNQQTGLFLSQKVLDFDVLGNNSGGGKIYFKTDGTFTMQSANTNDPTQNYHGVWALGDCRDCNTDYFQKDIQLDFKSTGWATDGYKVNGTPVTGYGTHLHGYISKDSNKWYITFAIDDPQASFNGEVKKDFQRDLIDK